MRDRALALDWPSAAGPEALAQWEVLPADADGVGRIPRAGRPARKQFAEGVAQALALRPTRRIGEATSTGLRPNTSAH